MNAAILLRRPLAGLVMFSAIACSADTGAGDQARLLEWRKLTITQALMCDEPLFAMNTAMGSNDLVAGSAAASETVRICTKAAATIASFGALPGKGDAEPKSADHPCGLDSLATARAAEQTVDLIDGDLRPSVQAAIKAALDDRARLMHECQIDMDARAKSLGLATEQLERIVIDERTEVTGAGTPRTTSD